VLPRSPLWQNPTPGFAKMLILLSGRGPAAFGSSPAFAGLSSCHRHDEFAFGEPAAHPPHRGEITPASASPQITGIGELRERRCRAPISPLLRGRKQLLGLGQKPKS